MTLKELMEKRSKAVADAQAIVNKAEAEKRKMTAEEDVQFNRFMDEADAAKKEVDALDREETRKSRLATATAELSASRGRVTAPDVPGRNAGDGDARSNRFVEVRGQRFEFAPGTPEHRRACAEYRAAFRAYVMNEKRALQSDLDTAGGYIVAQEQYLAELLKDLDDEVYVRSLARKFTINADSLGIPRRTNKMASASWGQELSQPVLDTSLKFGKRAITPHYMTLGILVSADLLRAAILNPEDIVRSEIARDSGELEEQAFMTGSGAGQPLGVFTASSDGISTARDVATGNTSTAITFDGLISAQMSLKKAYRRNAQWMFHRTAMSNIRKIKDSTGQFIWQQSMVAGQPDILLGSPVTESEWVPNTFTTGLYVGIYADWRFYWIVDSLQLELKRLDELYALSNQVGFIARKKTDGAPTIEEAFARVTLA